MSATGCALLCTAEQHSIPNRPQHTTLVTLNKGHHATRELRLKHMHYIYAFTHIYVCQFSNNTIMCSAFAVQAARNSASGWGRTSSSCLCSCAPLHHASFQPCYAMLQNVLQITHMQCIQDHMQSIYATLLQVPHATHKCYCYPPN